jgi:membrane protein
MFGTLSNKIRLFKRYLKRLLGIPFIGFIARVIDNMGSDGAVEMAGAISYYVILSIFPMLLGMFALLSFFLPAATIQDTIYSFVQRNLSGLEQVLQLDVSSIIAWRGPLGIISIISFFWSGSAMFGAINRAVNRAWEISRFRQLAIRKLRELAMSVSTTLFLLLSMAGTIILSFIVPGTGIIQGIGSRTITFCLVFAVFIIIYKWVPNTRTHWRLVWPGALLAAVFFELAQVLMSVYFANFTNFQLIYSSIGSIVILLIWVYFSAFIMVVGAEVSFEYSRRRLKLPLKRWKLVNVTNTELLS